VPTVRQRLVAAALHRYPLLSGAGRIANSGLTRALAGDSHSVDWAQGRSGALVLAPLDDFVGRAVFFVGDIDPKISRLCKMLLRPGDVALDIGANIGIVTATMARLVGPTGRVLAFEPNPHAFELLLATRERNGFANVDAYPLALGAFDGELPLTIPPGNLGSASLVPDDDAGEAIGVSVRRLADVLEEASVSAIRLAKLDVEGYEPEVLAGALPRFSTMPPDAILTECHSLESAHGLAVGRQLRELAYDVFVIARTLLRIRLVPLGRPAKGLDLAHDLLAIRPEAMTAGIASCITQE
jgi:FkbM family methyltransferase